MTSALPSDRWAARAAALIAVLDAALPPQRVMAAAWQEVAGWELVRGWCLCCLPGHLEPAGSFRVGAAPSEAECAAPSSDITVHRLRDGNVPIAELAVRHAVAEEGITGLVAGAIGRWAVDRLRLQMNARELTEENRALREVLVPHIGEHDIVTVSGAVDAVIQAAVRAAASTATVLISGETGTGKELLARLVHSHSPRAHRPLVTVNASALHPSLIDSELFGHCRGAFTGAERERSGLFEIADGSTIFLDEVGELSPETQTRLLRVLQERTITRLGEHRSVSVDVRVIAATHRDLAVEVAAGRFRRDLFYRLNVIALHVPPLRERREDIPVLVNHYLQRFNRAHFRSVGTVPPRVLQMLCAYAWPGNVRELENCIHKAVVLAEGEVLGEGLLPTAVRSSLGDESPADDDAGAAAPLVDTQLHQALEAYVAASDDISGLWAQLEPMLIRAALARERGVKLRAARRLGINRATLERKLQRYGIHVRRGRGAVDAPG